MRLCAEIRPRTAFPVHYEGWSHFVEGRAGIDRVLATAPVDVRSRFAWLDPGTATDVPA